MNLVRESRQTLLKHNLDSIFFESLAANELAFTENTLNNITQSGQLNLFKNDKILDLMNQWNTLSKIRQNRLDKSNYWNNNHLLPFLMPNISFNEIAVNGGYKWAGKSKVKPDYYPLFQKVEFENYIDNALWYWQQILDRLEETDILIDEIIEATKSKTK